MPSMVVNASPALPLGMPSAHFLRDYWQKRPLLIRGAMAGFTCPLTPEDLAGLACEELALSRLVQYDRASDRWSLRQGPFAEADFPGLPTQDWTLLVQDVDKWDADVRQLLREFDFIPRWRIDDVMVSFAARGGSVGAHVDHYDVFLLQGQGTRRWQIDARKHPPLAFREDVELKLLREFNPSDEWQLAPGDMLYLPPGVPHHGVAMDACLTFSIGMRAPAAAELIGDLADHLLEALPESMRYSDADLALPNDTHEIDAAALARVRTMLEANLALDDRMLATWLGGFLTRYRSSAESFSPPKAPTSAQVDRALAKGGSLTQHPFARFAWARSGRLARLFAHGQSWSMPISAAKRLCQTTPIVTADYLQLRRQADTALTDLLAAGLLVIQRGGR
ncbi:MAG: JmjC domain-containing protein [Pseudomarimonas sp.]